MSWSGSYRDEGPRRTARRMCPKNLRRNLAVLGAFWLALAPTGCVEPVDLAERSPGEVYRNQTLEIIVPFGPGGGTDTWARLMAPHLQRHLPQGARVQVVNVPGASSVAGGNQFAVRTRSDGRTAFVSAGSTFFAYILGEPMVRYDFRDFEPVVASPASGVVFVRPDLGVRELRDLENVSERLIYGGISATGNDLLALLAFEVMGLDVIPILGYTSKGASRLALQQGETNIEYQTTPAYLTSVVPLVEEGDAVPLFSFGMIGSGGEMVRDPAAPELPTVKEAYREVHGTDPEGPAWEAYRALLAAGVSMQKVLWMHGDAPSSAVEELRDAVGRMLEDPEFLEPARRQLGDYPFLGPEEIDDALQTGLGMPAEAMEWLRTLLRERYEVDRL